MEACLVAYGHLPSGCALSKWRYSLTAPKPTGENSEVTSAHLSTAEKFEALPDLWLVYPIMEFLKGIICEQVFVYQLKKLFFLRVGLASLPFALTLMYICTVCDWKVCHCGLDLPSQILFCFEKQLTVIKKCSCTLAMQKLQ